MRRGLITTVKFVASFPLAWFGGNLVFGILAGGSWLPELLHSILQEWAFDLVVNALLWIFRIGVFIALLIGWVFERQTTATPQI
jgi:hypothetical protein